MERQCNGIRPLFYSRWCSLYGHNYMVVAFHPEYDCSAVTRLVAA